MTDRRRVDEAMVETGDPAEHFLAVGVQLLQLVLDQDRVRRRTLLDQFLSEHDQTIDLIRVQRDLLLERLHDQHTHTQLSNVVP